MAIKATATATANEALVSSYIATANEGNAGEWAFMHEALKYSKSVREASVKEAQKISSLSLPNITATSVQYLDTLAVILDQFPEVETSVPFKAAFSLARKYDKGGAVEGRKVIKSAESIEQVIEQAPKRKGAGARPKSAEVLEGEAVDGDIYAMIYDYAQALTPADRMTFAKQLLDLAKTIKVMDTVTA